MASNQNWSHIQVVVVEDEPIILKNLCSKIEEADESFEIIGTSYNGKKAFQLISETKPDIVFTDILMPVCNGIELIRRMREAGLDMPVVVISGYDDFSYAQSVIKLGVTDYLLKPLIMPEFTKLLGALKARILSERVVIQREILSSNLHGRAGELPGQMKDGLFAVCLICLGNLNDRLLSSIREDEYRAYWHRISLEQLIRQECPEFDNWWLVDEMVGNQKFLILSLPFSKTILRDPFRRIHERLCNLFPELSITLCYHSVPVGASEFREVAGHLRWGLQSNLCIDRSQCFDEGKKNGLETELLTPSMLHKLSSTSSPEEISKLIECAIDTWRLDSLPQIQVLKGLEGMMSTLNSSGMLSQTSGDVYELHQQTLSLLSASKTPGKDRGAQLRDLLMESVRKSNFIVENASQFVEEIAGYICAHCSECISLSSVADRYGCSQAYISKVFKKVKNESPIKFITRIRMEKAIRMMSENPHMDFRLIGEAVGYCDQHYFSRNFKSYTGHTLTEYRKQLSSPGAFAKE